MKKLIFCLIAALLCIGLLFVIVEGDSFYSNSALYILFDQYAPADTTSTDDDTSVPPETTEPEPEEPVELVLPEAYVIRTVTPTSVTPTIDGNLTTEEWGATPDFQLDYGITDGQRTYCRDTFGGGGQHIPEIKYYWRYDDEYVYVAISLKEPSEYTAKGLTTTGISRALNVNMGGAVHRIVPDGQNITSAEGNMYYAYTYQSGVQYYELAAPRDSVVDLVNGKPGFLGFIEFRVLVNYESLDGLSSGTADITTRTTQIFANEKHTHDVFLLADGEPEEPVELVLPEVYVTRRVYPTSVTPTIDGNLTTEEWGATPDFYLDYSVTQNQRTYCRDTFGGGSQHIPEIKYYWRYDDEYVYVAISLKEPSEYTAEGLTTTGISRALNVNMGGAVHRIVPDGQNITSAEGNMYYAYTYQSGVQYYELAAPRDSVVDLVNGKPGFLGFIEFRVLVNYESLDGLSSGTADITTRTTQIFANEKHTHDVFLLADGEPPVELELPEVYETRTVKPTSVTPTIDGNLTTAEWGSTPDLHLRNNFITQYYRIYCSDTFAGDSIHMPEIKCYWRYDDEYVYVAISLKEPSEYTAKGLTTTGISRALNVNMGGAVYRIVPDGQNITSAVGNMYYAYTYQSGVQYYEFAASRDSVVDLVNGKPGFLGFIEFSVTINYDDVSENSSGVAEIITRTTKIFQNEKHTHDVFLLADGVPAPAPELDFDSSNPTTDVWNVQVKEGLTLRFGKPTVLEQGPEDDQVWGHYQFPVLTRYTDGSIRANWNYGQDDVEYTPDENPNGANHTVSYDNGETWNFGGAVSGCSDKNLMHNGSYFTGFTVKGGYQVDYLDKYTPAYTWSNDTGDFKMFFAEDIEETVDKPITASEYDPATGKTTSFEVTVNWPYMPLVQYPDKIVYPVTMMFALSNRAVISVDGDLYLPLYFYGFDSFADSRADAVKDYSHKFSIFFFKSTDNGRTWNLLSQIMTDDKIQNADEGLCEPEMTVMPDDSFVMLMRTGQNNPCYITRSTDGGESWSTPKKFDDIGVMPQLLTLDCGVTLASYGRPSMRFAVTDDPTGVNWSKHFDIPMVGGEGQSCYYTDLLALDEDTALFIYADFKYPNENGVPVKTILVRTVTVVSD